MTDPAAARVIFWLAVAVLIVAVTALGLILAILGNWQAAYFTSGAAGVCGGYLVGRVVR